MKRIEIGLRKPFVGDVVFGKVIELPPKTAVVCSPNVQAPVGETDWEYCLRQTLKNVSHSSRHTLCPWYIVRLPSQQPPSSLSPLIFWIETKWISNDPAPKAVCEKGKQVQFKIWVTKSKKFADYGNTPDQNMRIHHLAHGLTCTWMNWSKASKNKLFRSRPEAIAKITI